MSRGIILANGGEMRRAAPLNLYHRILKLRVAHQNNIILTGLLIRRSLGGAPARDAPSRRGGVENVREICAFTKLSYPMEEEIRLAVRVVKYVLVMRPAAFR